MELTLEEDGRNLSDDCSTLLLPALSIGNVGQLAIDLLVSSSGAKRVASLDEPSVLPCVGNDAYGPIPDGVLALPFECLGMMVEFARNFALFMSSIGKKHVVILSSLDSGRRMLDASSCMQICYLSSASDDGTDRSCEELGYKKLDEYNPSQRRWKHLALLAEGKSVPDDLLDVEDELVDEDYYAGLPFAALFSSCKAEGLESHLFAVLLFGRGQHTRFFSSG